MKLYTYRLLISWFGVQVTDDPPEEVKSLEFFKDFFHYGFWPVSIALLSKSSGAFCD